MGTVPGNRADVIVTMVRGAAQLRTLSFDRGSVMGVGGGMMGRITTRSSADTLIANLRVARADPAPLGPVPAGPAPRDLHDASPAGRRELTMAMGMGMGGGGQFTIGGRGCNPGRIDQTVVAVGTVEDGRSPIPAQCTTRSTCTSGRCN